MTEWGFIEQVLGGLQKNYFVMSIIQFEILDCEFHKHSCSAWTQLPYTSNL